ncbi:oligoendopeptidase F [Lactobacillus psittaci]|uniref:Oligopeptidase F n=1 Tax=Lactobacillus psittaci DSM 15354 TaxID=1122152 RepID=A0A0R1S2K0_9LACO|nr:oligoendopeptidase F [Lactobacillus psittaci]KRL63357.1 oligoendopeptidase F [Lactobacillus psittaci DSM 15354]
MALPNRKDVPQELTWDLTKIFKDDTSWEKEYQTLSNQLPQLAEISDNFTTNATNFYDGLTKIFSFDRQISKLYAYASLSSDVDTTNSHYLSYRAKAESLLNQYNAAISFMQPAILGLADSTLKNFYQEASKLNEYAHFIDSIKHHEKHVLDSRSESLIAAAGDALNASSSTYNVLSNSELPFGYTQDENGEMVQLSAGLYNQLIQSQDRNVRKMAFDSLYASYGSLQNTFAQTLAGNVKAHNYDAVVHNYPDARTASLDKNEITTDVYDNLIKVVNQHLPLLHRYTALRKKVLGLSELQMYDLYVPITGKPTSSYTFEQAKVKAKEALAVLGGEYLDEVNHIFDNRIIDPIESKGKTTGAYSGGSYDTEPYELLNWTNDFDALYTLVHETGHSVHSAFTRKNQPYLYGDYPIFLAEIASTTNENILTEYLLDHETDNQKRAFILNFFLDSFKGTIFRQTQFAEFEQFIHEADQDGEALTCDLLNAKYEEINQRYYGNTVPGSQIKLEWTRIPHFYYNFYVYQYATGFAAACALANNIIHGNDKQKQAYLNFLKSGSSKYPLETIKLAGVDMTQTTYLESAFKLFEQRLNELEKLL